MAATKFLAASMLLLSIFFAAGLLAIQTPAPAQRTPTIKVDVDLVLVNVTVTDRRNRYVRGLEKEHFRIWEDKIEQDILHFSNEDAAVTLGIIVDRSGSMGGSQAIVPGTPGVTLGTPLEWARSSAYSCLQEELRDDEYFLIEFSDEAKVVADFTSDVSKLRERLVFLGAGGRTALWDAIYKGVTKMDEASNSRKALLVLTDGEENHSRYSLSQLKDFLREKEVRIYFFNQGVNQLADLTGGRVFVGTDPCMQLKADLKNQYVIGYRSANRAADGKWRDIRVKLAENLPKQILEESAVRTRAGYYANTEGETGK